MKYQAVHNFYFQKVIQGFTKRLKDQGRPKNNADYLISHAREFLNYMENNEVDEVAKITQEKLEEYIEYLFNRPNKRRPGGLSVGYINKHREAVLRLLEYINNKTVGESGYYFPHFKRNSKHIEILTEEEVRMIYQACDDSLVGITDKAMLSLLYGCAMRRGEIHHLQVNDIDFGKGVIRLSKTKTKYEREVIMTNRVQENLEQYLYTAREMMLPVNSNVTHVLVTEQGTRMSLHTIPFRVRQMVARAGVNKHVTPHVFRHSIGTHLLKELSLEEVSVILGHRHLDSTQVYTHIAESNEKF